MSNNQIESSESINVTGWAKANIPAKTEQEVVISFSIPDNIQPGRYIIPVDLEYSQWNLKQFTEGVVTL